MNLNDRSRVTQLQVTVCVFRLNYVFHFTYSGRSDGGHFLRMCFGIAITRLLSHLPYFRNFDDVTNMVARCFSSFSAFGNAKFDLFGSENASWQIWLQTEIG